MHILAIYLSAFIILCTRVLGASQEDSIPSSSRTTTITTSKGDSTYHKTKKEYHSGLHKLVIDALHHQNQQKSLDSNEDLLPVKKYFDRKIEKHQKDLNNLATGEKVPGIKNAQHHKLKSDSHFRINDPSTFWNKKPHASGDEQYHFNKAEKHQDLLNRSMKAYTKQVSNGLIIPKEDINQDNQGILPVTRHFGRKVEKHKAQEMGIKSQSIHPGPKSASIKI